MVTKSVWGPCIWFLFHTLAFKAVPADFPYIKTDLMNFIQRICANLPCPECAQHASVFMKQHAQRIAAITTTEQLQHFLVDFHNSVNGRKGKPIFSYDQAENQYRLAKTNQVIQYFFKIYGERSNGNLKLITNGFHKQILLSEFSAWIVNNYSKFYL
jgi:hypothetical protein